MFSKVFSFRMPGQSWKGLIYNRRGEGLLLVGKILIPKEDGGGGGVLNRAFGSGV